MSFRLLSCLELTQLLLVSDDKKSKWKIHQFARAQGVRKLCDSVSILGSVALNICGSCSLENAIPGICPNLPSISPPSPAPNQPPPVADPSIFLVCAFSSGWALAMARPSQGQQRMRVKNGFHSENPITWYWKQTKVSINLQRYPFLLFWNDRKCIRCQPSGYLNVEIGAGGCN